MSLEHSNAQLQHIVRNISQFSSLYSDSQSLGWNSQTMEFKPFLHSSHRQRQSLSSSSYSNSSSPPSIYSPSPSPDLPTNFYFRLFHASPGLKFVKQKYKKLFKLFQGQFINVEVQLVDQKLHDCIYLIRGTENYFSLQRLIENSERKILTISFIVRLLEFFSQLIGIVEKAKVNIDLRAGTILERDGVFKLADYNLLFHPNNLRKENKDLESDLIRQMKYVIFDVLSLKNRENRENFMMDSLTLIKQLKERRSQSTSTFIYIIEEFLQDGIVPVAALQRLRSTPLTINSSVDMIEPLDRTLTSSDISIPLLNRQDTTISQSQISTIKPKIDRKKLWRIMFVVVIVVIIASLGVAYYFLTRDIDCGKFHYEENRRCYSCPESCYSCVGGGEYKCTYCITSYWLVLKSTSDTYGKCSAECMGFKDMSTMHCLPLG